MNFPSLRTLAAILRKVRADLRTFRTRYAMTAKGRHNLNNVTMFICPTYTVSLFHSPSLLFSHP